MTVASHFIMSIFPATVVIRIATTEDTVDTEDIQYALSSCPQWLRVHSGEELLYGEYRLFAEGPLKNRRLVLPIAVVYTGAAALAVAFCLLAIAASFYYRPTVERTGSGGIGAVSAGLGDPIVVGTLLFVLAGVIVNISVARAATRRGRRAIAIRRAHLALAFATLAWPLPFGLLLIYLSEHDTQNVMAVGAACGVLFSGMHAAFGVYAINLLRRDKETKPL
jgi:hypothetical protein